MRFVLWSQLQIGKVMVKERLLFEIGLRGLPQRHHVKRGKPRAQSRNPGQSDLIQAKILCAL